MATVETVLERLKEQARPDQLAGMARYGMTIKRRLGVSIPELRKLAKEQGRDHELALDLWRSGIADARILASMIDDPNKVTDEQIVAWVKDINSRDICDQVCMNLFEKIEMPWSIINEFSQHEEEFVKRTAFSLLACLAWRDKKAEDEKFIELLPTIKYCSTDERNYVKKAVNWALRNIGKRNTNLHRYALKMAREIRQLKLKSARWIATDAIRELESEAVQKRLNR